MAALAVSGELRNALRGAVVEEEAEFVAFVAGAELAHAALALWTGPPLPADPYAGWADIVTDPAARAVIHRFVRRRLVILAEALCLRTNVLRPREKIGDRADRAGRRADIALDTVIQRLFER